MHSGLACKVTGKLKLSQRISGFALVVSQLRRQVFCRGELACLTKPGDEIEITVSNGRRFEVARDRTIERALASIRKFRGRMPAGFKFDRGAANERR